ncbi:MAG: aminopeptidase P family protein [Breznakibacter sp.]
MFETQIYVNRRHTLKHKMNEGVILLLGNSESPMNYADNTYHFRQDSTFLYFIGLDMPDLAAVIDIDNDTEVLFGDDADIHTVIWTGKQASVRERADKSGISEVKTLTELSTFLNDCLKKDRKIHFTPPYRGENILRLSALLNIPHQQICAKASLQLIRACIDIRSIKETCEIEELERHMEVAYQMHVTAMKMAQPGVRESEITGAIEGISIAAGNMVSFPVICSVRGETLHNHSHSNILKQGDLLLVDAGSESPLHYATDHTRTTPVGGKFSPRQRDVYQIVLNANNAVHKTIKPGIPYIDVHFAAAREIAEGLKQLGLLKGNIDDILAEGAHALFFPHGIGHMLGLDVHDMEDYDDTLVGYDNEFKRSSQFGLRSLRLGRRLQPGFMVTNEPGIYFIPDLIGLWKSQHKFTEFINYDKVETYIGFGGVRLEDDVLVTRTGSRILGNRIPIEIDEVQRIAQSGR